MILFDEAGCGTRVSYRRRRSRTDEGISCEGQRPRGAGRAIDEEQTYRHAQDLGLFGRHFD